ncbi:MAG: hypothetical protein IJ179_06120 [Oscillospiraceae bacterium]|nr:hypothetical protein [Oscillospiraceae bacterium]MBQ9249927.1 hypothetical protein [Oscillospiraceae bacterium]
MEKRTWTITLADGTALEGLDLNGNNYISSKKITEDVFDDNLGVVTISDGEHEEVHENMALVQITKVGAKYWFILRDLTAQEIADLRTQANIEYIAMMADIDLEEV